MLILKRRAGESLMIGTKVTVKVLRVKGNQIRIGVSAPKDVTVYVRKPGNGSTAPVTSLKAVADPEPPGKMSCPSAQIGEV